MSSILKVDQLQDSGGNAIITSNGSGTFTSSLPNTGITMADQWRLTADLTANAFPISANLERVDDESFSKIGTGMTESSGTFSFPKTGLYKVEFIGRVINGSADTISGLIHVTINNSTYDAVALNSAGASAGTYGHSLICSALVNVTDISNVKVRFEASSVGSGSNFEGDTDRNQTCFTFIRLGDSQ